MKYLIKPLIALAILSSGLELDAVCRQPLQGPIGPTGPQGPAGELTLAYLSAISSDQDYTTNFFLPVLFTNTSYVVDPLGINIESINRPNDSFTVDEDGIYEITWKIIVTNQSDVFDTYFQFNSSFNPPSNPFPLTLDTIFAGETVNLSGQLLVPLYSSTTPDVYAFRFMNVTDEGSLNLVDTTVIVTIQRVGDLPPAPPPV